VGKPHRFRYHKEKIVLYFIEGFLATHEQINELKIDTKLPRYIGTQHKMILPSHCLTMEGYEIQEFIGLGSSGSVHKACDIDKNCTYAIKIENITESRLKFLFDEEVKITEIFNRNNIGPKYYGSWICEGLGFIVTELWDGQLPNVKLSDDVLRKFRDQIDKLHDLGYVHADILPKNVLVKYDSHKNVKDITLTDFSNSDTIEAWKSRPTYLKIFYDYISVTIAGLYFKKNNITVDMILNDPRLLDFGLLDYYSNYK
jgi:serine/threonine protein kinase